MLPLLLWPRLSALKFAAATEDLVYDGPADKVRTGGAGADDGRQRRRPWSFGGFVQTAGDHTRQYGDGQVVVDVLLRLGQVQQRHRGRVHEDQDAQRVARVGPALGGRVQYAIHFDLVVGAGGVAPALREAVRATAEEPAQPGNACVERYPCKAVPTTRAIGYVIRPGPTLGRSGELANVYISYVRDGERIGTLAAATAIPEHVHGCLGMSVSELLS
mmetsp:Transcript_8966/g.19759  ORF Transcript_8966/g.19759 Transcript_8966/m.19759 type:complete len:217 (+) Transcript_8966:493-1143(+)